MRNFFNFYQLIQFGDGGMGGGGGGREEKEEFFRITFINELNRVFTTNNRSSESSIKLRLCPKTMEGSNSPEPHPLPLLPLPISSF